MFRLPKEKKSRKLLHVSVLREAALQLQSILTKPPVQGELLRIVYQCDLEL